MNKPGRSFQFFGLALLLGLGSCSQTPDAAPDPAAVTAQGDLGPYAGGVKHPWSDRQATALKPGENPYADGKQYPWTGPGRSASAADIKAQALGSGDNYLSDLTWTSATNGWGPVEKDLSNGEHLQGDGQAIKIGGVSFAKGLGVHASSQVSYALNGTCTTFSAQVGLDDEVGDRGSVVFQVFADGTKVYDSGVMTGADPARAVSVSMAKVNELRLVVTDGGDNNYFDHADWAAAKVNCGVINPGVVNYLSDAAWSSATNGWGPVEKDSSNGEYLAMDGRPISIGGVGHTKGLGMHAGVDVNDLNGSLIEYDLRNSTCTTLKAQVGIDDEVGPRGSVVFQVYGNNFGVRTKLYDSGVIRGGEAARPLSADLSGFSFVDLVVTNAGDNNYYDHADWADARLECSAPLPAPQLSVLNLDGGPFPNRLAFSKVGFGNPVTPSSTEHNVSTVRVSNNGAGPLDVTVQVTGAFSIPATSGHLLIGPGSSVDVPVRFTGEGARIYQGNLTLISNDASAPSRVLALTGVWQSQYENGQEPTLENVANDTLGFQTRFAPGGTIHQDGHVAPQGDEVLSPYWQRADATAPVVATVLATYHTQGNVATLYWHPKGSDAATPVVSQTGSDSQSILPRLNGASTLAKASFSPSASTFGFRIDGNEWSDPTKNDQSADHYNGCVDPCGQHLRFFVAKDPSGQVMPNTYVMIMDYSGINYDYNDNIYLISNVRPAPVLIDTGLAAGAKTTDPAGNIWVSDRDSNGFASFAPTSAINEPATASNATILNTTFPQLYRTYRGNVGSVTPRTLTYNLPLENGTYQVKLHFADLAWTVGGKRVFNVISNGQTLVPNLDIVARSGGGNTALVIPVTVQVTNGLLNLQFTASIDYPSVAGLEITR